MGGYRQRERKRWWAADRWWLPADRFGLPYTSASVGFGLFAISLGVLVTGGSLIVIVATALVGAGLLAYGSRNY